jgi:outer membrane lipoprotein-sorting protein
MLGGPTVLGAHLTDGTDLDFPLDDSGKSPRVLIAGAWFLWLIAVLSIAMSSPIRAADPQRAVSEPVDGLEELMALFERSGGVRAEFSESRYISILEDPIETRGVLYFSPPANLARYTSQPDDSSLVTDGSQVTLSDRTGTKTISLGSSELARELVNSFLILLRGDLEALHAGYEVKLHSRSSHDSPDDSPHESPWILDLKPRSPQIRELIARVRIEGSANKLSAMETLEKNGDKTLMVFSVVETGLEFNDEQIDLLFSLQAHDRAL